jgi:hypothetical protein
VGKLFLSTLQQPELQSASHLAAGESLRAHSAL